jgi:hypothetical protein
MTETEEQNAIDAAVDALTARYRNYAREHVHDEGELEVDDDAAVNLSEGGAYIQAWVWIGEEELNG